MFKKILVFLFIIVTLTLNVSAKDDEVFYTHGSANNYVSEILGMTEDELKDYVEDNSITYLAVNKDNTKQIKMVEIKDGFSKKVDNLLALKDKEILELTQALSGIEGVKGEVFEKGKYKFLKIEAKTTDSGGEYILTQYITVNKGVKQVLSFYTSSNQSTEYIQEYFNSIFSIKETSAALKVLSIASISLFGILAVIVLYAIIKETFYKNRENQEGLE